MFFQLIACALPEDAFLHHDDDRHHVGMELRVVLQKSERNAEDVKSQFSTKLRQPLHFQLFERFWIGRVFINRDDAGCAGMRRSKRFREETFGRLRVSGRVEFTPSLLNEKICCSFLFAYAKLCVGLNVEKPVDAYQIIYQRHAVERMAQRGIREEDVEQILLTGETIEAYPHDTPYPSELLLGWCEARPLHIVVATDIASQRKIVITVYKPDPNKWEADFKRRKP